ncbi:MAG: T9SS type A sorting domain-containing protein [Bacteroidota bacterium]
MKFLLTSDGIEGPFIQHLGWYPEDYQGGGGESEFSSDGTRYVFNSSRSGMEIYDFDRQTGEFTFVDTIDRREETADIFFTGIGLSPSGRFAYVSENTRVFQYDLDAEDIEESRILLHTFTNPDSIFIHPHSNYFQLGPDCKLYNYMNSGRYIHRINNPDLPGLACDYEVNAIELPFPAFRDQPQFPHFRLGPVGDEGSPCVESPNSTETVQAPKAELKVYPNPSSGPIRLFLPVGEAAAMWRLYDLQGRPLQELSLLPGQDQRVDVTAALPAGTYLWQLFREGKVVETGRIIRN